MSGASNSHKGFFSSGHGCAEDETGINPGSSALWTGLAQQPSSLERYPDNCSSISVFKPSARYSFAFLCSFFLVLLFDVVISSLPTYCR